MSEYCDNRGTTYVALNSFDEIKLNQVPKILGVIEDNNLIELYDIFEYLLKKYEVKEGDTITNLEMREDYEAFYNVNTQAKDNFQKAFANVCKNYGLNEINVNASNVNVGIVAIELMKKILSKTYKSNIYNHNDENIYRVNGKMCQFGSYVISKPALTRQNAKAFEKVLVLVHSNTTKGIYALDKTTAINLNKRLSISDIVNNGKKVLDF